MRTVLILQARMAATRLPGKPLKQVLGKSLLAYLIERLKRVKQCDGLIVATTTNPKDRVIEQECQILNVPLYRGDEEDVLDRYLQTAKREKADVIVRITGDCPLIDPAVIDRVVSYFLEHACDYVSNTIERTYPRGMDVEVFSLQALEKIARLAKLPQEREHVTLFIYSHPDQFSLANIAYERNLSHFRWTVDTPEDFELIKRMLEAIYPLKPEFTLEDLIALMHAHPDWAAINAHIVQKNI